MFLKSLLTDLHIQEIFGSEKVNIRGITDDSRNVKKGDLFVAIKGHNVDAHKYIPNAVNQGAVAVIGEEKPKDFNMDNTTFIQVADSRKALGLVASAWYGNPSKKMKIIGVTGTDGKTTTSSLIYWILKHAGKKVGLISTVSAKIGSKDYDTGFHVTNPEPLALHNFLAKMVKKECEYCILEVTSHGLDQERVVGIEFEIGVLTNITHEHIDYHKNIANYMKAKAKLFNESKVVFLNNEDSSYEKIKKLIKRGRKIKNYSYKTIPNIIKEEASIRFSEKYNLTNFAAAYCVAKNMGIDDSVIAKAVKSFPSIEGRMQEMNNNEEKTIIVDFAHTPNALENVLGSLRERLPAGKKLIVVFGCAGERDVKKRSLMPAVSVKFADLSVFTAEDPRSENIDKILKVMAKAAIRNGAEENKDFYCIPERGEAIFFAINKLAKKADIIVVCGKGHERSMAYNGVEYSWSDQEAVKLALKGKIKKI